MNDYSNKNNCCCKCFVVFPLSILLVGVIIAMCFFFTPKAYGITLELSNKRAAAIYDTNTVIWNDVLSETGDNSIIYDSTTGEITFTKSGHYYVNYYFNVIPNTINEDFNFSISGSITPPLTATGSGSNSGSPTAFVSTQGIVKVASNTTITIDYSSTGHNGILLGDTGIQGNITILYLGS